jgi:Kef-type K+ transport system membrane component KefB
MTFYVDARRLSGHGGGDAEDWGDDLMYLFLFWIITYASSILAKVTNLAPALFYLLFGVILANAVTLKPSTFLDVLAEVAIVIVFFALGFEESVKNFVGGIKMSWGIASIGAIVPFGCGLLHAMCFFPDVGIKPQFMYGLAVTATAVSLTMIALKSEGLSTSKAAIGIMTSAVLDDVACLALVAVAVPVATGQADPTVEGVTWVLCKCAIFFMIIAFLHLIVFPHDLSKVPILKHVPFIRSVGVHHLLRFNSGEQAIVVSLLIGLATGLMARAFDFHPAIGAYMSGLILEEKYFDLEKRAPLASSNPWRKTRRLSAVEVRDRSASKGSVQVPGQEVELEIGTSGLELASNDGHASNNVYHHVKETLENAAFLWIGPIFFIHLGAQIKLDFDIMQNVVIESLTLYVALFIGQIASAAFAARYIPGGFTWVESLMIGFGMLGRAELFFVVLDICYIEHQIFTTEMFYSLTFAAMFMNISVPITISLFKPYYVGEKTLPCGGKPEEETAVQMGLPLSG